ncbi:MAG: ornithine carbamoyltransferase [Firmicutes bacterium]|nr:ornithine carbamoyltransferase [Bacillota bacterium]
MNFISINNLNDESIRKIFGLANSLKKSSQSPLVGMTLVLFFPESSIRTRLTFEKGIQDLGGKCILFPPSTLDKREESIDVIRYIENWADAVIVRHSDFDKISRLAQYSKIPVINAMSSYNHPCEIMSDIYSISKVRPNYRSLSYTFVGENGNISNSWRIAAEVLDLKLNHVCIEGNKIKENDDNYSFSTNLEEILPKSDVVLTDPLSKKLRVDEYIEKYQITLEKMNRCKSKSLLNPCPPFYRGEEVSADVIDSKYFVGYEFKKNLIYVQQAIILYCLGIEIE